MKKCRLIIRELKRRGLKFPKRALELAVENQELITPELLKLLEHDCENITKLPKRYCGHLYALYLLAQFKEKRALPLIMKIISRRSERVLRFIFGDVLTEDLGRIIASVCGGELSPIKKLIEDERSNE